MTKEKTNPYEVEKTRIFAGLMFIGLILFFGVLDINLKILRLVVLILHHII